MRKKNLNVTRKAKIKLFITNIKTKKVYSKFKSVTLKMIGKEDFALSVSGGSDSLCLAYLGKIYTSELGNKMHVLIVDHKLRKESRKEALQAKKILKSKGIPSNLLSWKGSIPKNNIQSKARNIRYSLIAKYCKVKKIKFLFTAHHMDDQIENFFIRLFRGSGLSGLSSMTESFDYNKSLKIIRPLLDFKKEDLKKLTLNYFHSYIEDPSNEDEKYLRIRIRKHRKKMEKEGLNSEKIIKTVNNLISANNALKFYKKKAIYKYVSFLSKNKCLINKKIFSDEAGEVIFKSFSDVFSLISGAYYPPRSKKIINLIKRAKKSTFTKSTLGGCVIEKKGELISISKETKVKKVSYELAK